MDRQETEPPSGFDSHGSATDRFELGMAMIILGVVLLLIGFVAKIAILETVGLVLLAVGVVLMILGSTGRAVGGRHHYW